jgi:uncharacterized membrane protein
MTIFLSGLFIFLGVHSISIVADSWRNRVAERIGEWAWKVLYALGSILGLILIVWGYGLARGESVDLYTPQLWLRQISLLLFVPVFPLLIAAYFPGRIKAAVRHPMLLATQLWALAHLMSNGSLVNVILFGSFLLWAVLDFISLQQRHSRPLPGAPRSRYNDVLALILGICLYFAFIFRLHQLLLGISPV